MAKGAPNVLFTLNRTKRSSVLLLCVVRFNVLVSIWISECVVVKGAVLGDIKEGLFARTKDQTNIHQTKIHD